MTIKRMKDIGSMIAAATLIPWFILGISTTIINNVILAKATTEKTKAIIVGEIRFGRAGFHPYMFEIDGRIYSGRITGPYDVGDTVVVEYWPRLPEVNDVLVPDKK